LETGRVEQARQIEKRERRFDFIETAKARDRAF
jgi:hypothetical protein